MTKVFKNAYVTLTTSEADIYTAPATALSLLIQAVNPTDTTATCELWMTNDSNTHVACLFPSQSIAGYNGITDTTKHIFATGFKIRGVASVESTVYVEVSILEGM